MAIDTANQREGKFQFNPVQNRADTLFQIFSQVKLVWQRICHARWSCGDGLGKELAFGLVKDNDEQAVGTLLGWGPRRKLIAGYRNIHMVCFACRERLFRVVLENSLINKVFCWPKSHRSSQSVHPTQPQDLQWPSYGLEWSLRECAGMTLLPGSVGRAWIQASE